MHSYSSQLARIHVEHYLFQLMQSYPELNGTAEDAPPTSKCCPAKIYNIMTLYLYMCVHETSKGFSSKANLSKPKGNHPCTF